MRIDFSAFRRVGLVVLLLGSGLWLAGGSSASIAASAACEAYGKAAVKQNERYVKQKCFKPGNADWWSADPDYHASWCDTLPASSPLPAKGMADREAVLEACVGECPTPWATAGISGRKYSAAECKAICDGMVTGCRKSSPGGIEGCSFCLD